MNVYRIYILLVCFDKKREIFFWAYLCPFVDDLTKRGREIWSSIYACLRNLEFYIWRLCMISLFYTKREQSFSKLTESSWPPKRNDVPRSIWSESTPWGSDAELPKHRVTQTRSYPDAKLLKVANQHDSSANLFQSGSRIENEAELNHHGDVRTSHTINQSNSKYFEAWTIPLQTHENFEGVLLTL